MYSRYSHPTNDSSDYFKRLTLLKKLFSLYFLLLIFEER